MDFFDGASDKLAREQKLRRENLKKKRDEETKRRLKAEEASRQMEAEAEKARKILKQKEHELELAKQRELVLTGGIEFSFSFNAVAIDSENDKIILPESSLEELTKQREQDSNQMIIILKL